MPKIIISKNLALTLLPIAFSFLALGVTHQSSIDIIKVSIWYLACIVPLSIASSTLLLQTLELSIFESLCLGYPTAVVVTSAYFWILKSVGLLALFPILPIASVAYLIKSKIGKACETKRTDAQTFYGITTIYSIASILFFFLFTLTTGDPTDQFGNNVYEDILWTIGNTWSLIRNGLPLEDSRFSDVSLNYHIGQNLYYSAISLTTHVDPVQLHLRIAPYYDLFFLVGTLYSGCRAVLKLSSLSSIISTVPLIFGITQITSFKVGGDPGISEIWFNPISLFFGISSFLVLTLLISNIEKVKGGIMVYATLLFALAMSTKGIAGIIIPATLILCSARKIRSPVVRLRTIQLLVCLSGCFLMLKLAIFNSAESYISYPQIEVSPVALKFGNLIGAEELVEKAYVIIGPISRLVRFMFHTLVWNWYTVPIILVCFMKKEGRDSLTKSRNYFATVVSLAIVCGIIYSMNIFNVYYSNLYLYKYTTAGVALFSGIFLGDFLKSFESSNVITSSHTGKSQMISRLAFLLASVLLTLPIINFALNKILHIGSNDWKIDRGMLKTWRPLAFLSRDEFEAMIWIRNNLDNSSVIASDRREKEGWSGNYIANVWFNYSAYSGKQFYNEGDDFNPFQVSKVAKTRWKNIQNLLSSQTASEAIKNWSNVDADYLIVTKRLGTASNYLLDNATAVFENEGILIIVNPNRVSRK